MDKRSLRRGNFARIKSLSTAEKADHSDAIARHLANHSLLLEAATVFSYAAMSSEPDLSRLRTQFPAKTWALSRVADDGESLHFHQVAEDQALVKSQFGFEEPDPATSPVITAPDLILVPGVGFDPDNGARLGRGKGHYDRYLAPLIGLDQRPKVIGICFSTQLIDLLPESHDIPMDFIVSELGIHAPTT